MPSRSFGWRASPDDPRDFGLDRLGVSRLGAPPPADWSSLVGTIRDQGFTSSCVGFGVAQAWLLRARIQGDVAAERPSELDIYALARAAEYGPGGPFSDSGSIIRLALSAINKLGVCPGSVRPFDEADVNNPSAWNVRQASADRRGVQYARLSGALDARYALAAGHPVVIGIKVDNAFLQGAFGADAWPGLTGPVLGGHCMSVCGSKPGALRVVNSWTSQWADGGFAWVCDDVVDGGEAWAVELI